MKFYHTFLLLLIVPCVAFSFRNIRCPYQSEWRIRSSFVCNGTETKNYTCLYNAIKRSYEESCKFKPVISGYGSQYVISVHPNSEPCRHHDRYQPFPLGSNVSHVCVFQKSTCREEGQVLFHQGSPKKDLTCRCNFQKGYAFLNEKTSKCDCIPSKEDCSCYMKNNQCLPGHRLISDYICLHKDNKYHIQKCPEMGPERKETPYSRQLFRKEPTHIDLLNRRSEVIVLTILSFCCIVYAFFAILLITAEKIPDFCSIDICPYNLNTTREGGLLCISWSKPDKVPYIDILHYNLYNTFNKERLVFTVTGDKRYVLKDLLPSTDYSFRVSVSLTNSIESKCTQEIIFNPGLPEKPICRSPYGDNGSIVLLWDSPQDTLIKIDEYVIQISTDDWKTFKEISKHSDVLKHEIKNATEGLTYRCTICSCSNSVRSSAQKLEPFPARHDTLRAIVRFETSSKTDPGLVEKDAGEVLKKVSNGLPVHTSNRDGSIIVDIIFISDGCCNEKLLYDTLKTAFQKEMTGAYTIKFTNLWLERLNNPSPPQLENISRVNNGVLISWKEPSRTFFKPKEYAVEYTKNNWNSRHDVTVPANNKSLTIWNVLPSAKVQVKVYTCICHQIRSSSSLEVSIDTEEEKNNRPDITVIYLRDENVAEKMTAIGLNKSNTPIFQSIPSEIHMGKDNSHASCQAAMTKHSNEEKDNIWLFDILNTIGMNHIYRKTLQETGISSEILESFQDKVTCYRIGSSVEGTAVPGDFIDFDFMRCVERFPVIEDISKAHGNLYSLLIVSESNAPAGYVKLQLVIGDLLCTSKEWKSVQNLFHDHVFKIDRHDRIVLLDCLLSANWRPKKKPADLTSANVTHKYSFYETDAVISYRGSTWPTMANEWLSRKRQNGWPTDYVIRELKLLGFFVVRKGHPFSLETDLEWRIFFLLQERKLMFNLTDVQHKCYVVLKMLNRDIINLNCITAYHWKTCLFYAIEENNDKIWKKTALWYCIRICIRLMLKWVTCGFCPNYFIPRENLFDGRLTKKSLLILRAKLMKILNLGFRCLLSVTKGNMCDLFKSRDNFHLSQQLQENSKTLYNEVLYRVNLSLTLNALFVFNKEILEHNYYHANENTHAFIELLWSTLNNIQYTCGSITIQHTEQDIHHALSLLLPNIYDCLASNISAIAIKNPNPQIRNFLLLGSVPYFRSSGLPGHLKLISVLYAAELYTDCEWWIDSQDEEYIKNLTSICMCRIIERDAIPFEKNINYTSQIHLSNCVSFLPTELLIAPDVMKYEMFKHVGIQLDKPEKYDHFCGWHYRAVVDSHIYFFLLKYLIKRKLKRFKACEDAIHNILNLMTGPNVRHRDVALNVLAWICYSEFETHRALLFAKASWWAMITSDIRSLNHLPWRCKQYQYNAAKIHALVILYNTWVAKKQSIIN